MRVEHNPNLPALAREWLVARIVGVAGLLLLLAIAIVEGASLFSQPPATTAAGPVPAPPAGSDTVVIPSTSAAEARRQENLAICTAALGAAQKLGIVPAFATLASGETQNTDVQGRYICLARTDAAKYSLDFDLTCTNLAAGDCISLYTVSQSGGGVLYQRK